MDILFLENFLVLDYEDAASYRPDNLVDSIY